MNTKKLKTAMKENRVTIIEMAAALGISRSAYIRKMNGETEFTCREITAVVDYLHLQSPMEIFFADYVS